jgi:heavy metal sensor kinase
LKLKGIGLRLTAWYFCAVSFSLLLFGLGSWVAVKRVMYHALDQELDGQVSVVRAFLERQGAGATETDLRTAFKKHSVLGPLGEVFQVLDQRGTWLYRSPVLENANILIPSVEDLAAGRVKEDKLVQGVKLRFRSKRVLAGGRYYAVQVTAPVYSLDEGLARFRAALLLLVPLAILISTLGGFWLSRRALRPVDDIILAARSIGENNLSLRLPVPFVQDELYRLSITLNEMLGRIEGAFQRMTRFTADASHELRTPVGLILASADLALRRPRESDEYRAALIDVKSEAVWATKLIERLMELARADSDQSKLTQELVDLNRLAGEVGQHAEPLAASKGLGLEVSTPDGDCRIMADPMAVRRLLIILLDNAVKYTPSGGRVRMALTARVDRIEIEVEDTGVGIPSADQPHIFDRFYRSEKSRSRDLGGMGLGLALAKWIVESHRGTISVRSQISSGSTFLVELPRSTP